MSDIQRGHSYEASSQQYTGAAPAVVSEVRDILEKEKGREIPVPGPAEYASTLRFDQGLCSSMEISNEGVL